MALGAPTPDTGRHQGYRVIFHHGLPQADQSWKKRCEDFLLLSQPDIHHVKSACRRRTCSLYPWLAIAKNYASHYCGPLLSRLFLRDFAQFPPTRPVSIVAPRVLVGPASLTVYFCVLTAPECIAPWVSISALSGPQSWIRTGAGCS